MPTYQYLFLGGIFPSNQESYIKEKSIGVLQNAADTFQKKMIVGFDYVLDNGIVVVNLPFVGSFPKYFSDSYFESAEEYFGIKSRIHTISFVNIFAIRIISRFFSALKGLFSVSRRKISVVLFVYSAHMPFILAALFYKALRPKTKLCLILPDFPEHMGDNGRLRTLLKKIDVILFYALVKKFNYYVFLTQQMAEKLKVDQKNYVVVEGVAARCTDFVESFDCHESGIKSFLYTGTLSKLYGITELLNAFKMLEDYSVELWICGDGDGRSDVQSATFHDKRIKYFGQLDKLQIYKLQSRATFLINPRMPSGEYTKYSFPSKVIEYMSTGRPVIMYKLDGIPDDYDSLYIVPPKASTEGLYECMKNALNINEADLINIGLSAQHYVLNSKSPETQANKIIDMIEKES